VNEATTLGVSSHLESVDQDQMLDIPRHVDAEGVHSIEHEIVICTQEESVYSQNLAEHSKGRLHDEVQKASTEDQKPQANELQHEEV